MLHKKKTAIFILILAVFLLVTDRFLKFFAFTFDVKYNLLGDILRFNFAKNYYIAFSLPLGGTILIAIITVILLFLIAYSIKLAKNKEFIEVALLTNVLFGAISNLLDRLQLGYVIDYIDLKYFTVFNVADTMIVGGVIGLFLIQLIRDKKITTS